MSIRNIQYNFLLNARIPRTVSVSALAAVGPALSVSHRIEVSSAYAAGITHSEPSF